MIVSQSTRLQLLKDTENLRVFNGGTKIRKGDQYIFVYPNFGTPDGYPEHTAHRFQVVRVIKKIRVEGGSNYLIQAEDGWTGEADGAELFPFDPTRDLDLPAGLSIEMDEDGPTQDGSVAIKRAVINFFHENGAAIPEEDLPEEIRNIARAWPLEYGEVVAEFEANPSAAYR